MRTFMLDWGCNASMVFEALTLSTDDSSVCLTVKLDPLALVTEFSLGF